MILLMSMVNEKQPITLRCAVLYCFQCFLSRNEFGQSRLIQTLLPSTVERKLFHCDVDLENIKKQSFMNFFCFLVIRRHDIYRSTALRWPFQPRLSE